MITQSYWFHWRLRIRIYCCGGGGRGGCVNDQWSIRMQCITGVDMYRTLQCHGQCPYFQMSTPQMTTVLYGMDIFVVVGNVIIIVFTEWCKFRFMFEHGLGTQSTNVLIGRRRGIGRYRTTLGRNRTEQAIPIGGNGLYF